MIKIKQHPIYDDLFLSEDGDVYLKAPKELHKKYLFHRYGNRHLPIHRLMADTFLGPKPAHMVTRHYNDVKTDNRLRNIRYGTHQDNADDKVRNGLQPTHETHGRTRLNDNDVEDIRIRLAAGDKLTNVAASYGLSIGTVHAIKTYKTWKPRKTS